MLPTNAEAPTLTLLLILLIPFAAPVVAPKVEFSVLIWTRLIAGFLEFEIKFTPVTNATAVKIPAVIFFQCLFSLTDNFSLPTGIGTILSVLLSLIFIAVLPIPFLFNLSLLKIDFPFFCS